VLRQALAVNCALLRLIRDVPARSRNLLDPFLVPEDRRTCKHRAGLALENIIIARRDLEVPVDPGLDDEMRASGARVDDCLWVIGREDRDMGIFPRGGLSAFRND
jgi:hypothetical protein